MTTNQQRVALALAEIEQYADVRQRQRILAAALDAAEQRGAAEAMGRLAAVFDMNPSGRITRGGAAEVLRDAAGNNAPCTDAVKGIGGTLLDCTLRRDHRGAHKASDGARWAEGSA